MASFGSSVATLLVVEIIDRERPQFKKHPYKSMEDDLNGSFSYVPYRVLNVEDIRAYIHYNIEEFGNAKILSLYTKHVMDGMGNLKPDFKSLKDKCFIQFVNFLIFDELEWVKYILSKVRDEFIWLDKPYKITKNEIKVVTCLNATGEVPGLRNVKNTIVTEVTNSQHDSRSMTISDIIEYDVRFASMVMSYKVYQSSRAYSVFDTAIYVAYQILKENKLYDLCGVLLSELMSNMKKIKQDKKHVFKFGTLIIFLAFYFMNEIPSICKIQGAYDKLVEVQIKEALQGLGDAHA